MRKDRTLFIKNPEAYPLASRLSRRLGVTLTDAVITVLAAQLDRAGKRFDPARVEAICAGLDRLPVIGDRTPDEILDYDEAGLPR